MFERRDVLKAALGVMAAGLSPGQTRAESDSVAPQASAFTRETVVDLARTVASKPYTPPPGDLREPFAGLNYEQFVSIKTRPGAAIWASENKGFSIEPLHRGHIFSAAVEPLSRR